MVDAAWLKPPEKLSAREPQFAHFSDRFIARTDPAAGAKRLKSADAVLLFSLLFLAIPGLFRDKKRFRPQIRILEMLPLSKSLMNLIYSRFSINECSFRDGPKGQARNP
jgi:hypothetical protein